MPPKHQRRPPEPRDPTPIATADQFAAALIRVRDTAGVSPKELGILRAFCRVPEHTLTAPKLAEAAGLSSWHEANLQFGTLAKAIGEALHYTPSKRQNGSLRWWVSLAYGAEDEDDATGDLQWTLRPELVEALQRMRWA